MALALENIEYIFSLKYRIATILKNCELYYNGEFFKKLKKKES